MEGIAICQKMAVGQAWAQKGHPHRYPQNHTFGWSQMVCASRHHDQQVEAQK